MELNFLSRAIFFFFLLLSLFSSFSSSTVISDGVFQSQSSFTGRNLLQTKKPCPVNFEFMNYKIITDKCKGPKFPPKECCAAFKEFSCPYADELNDLSSDCATTMFSYINLYGKYPPGLFANQCKEGKEGLECPATSPTSADDASAATAASSSCLWLTLSAAFLVSVKLF
ncbi:PREDICTED: GPI-anchored protein LORELEI [Camelina sativa]|uniref:GPI-anchored protein LORELEI n=1 Tax=Camelina sativa TaxID=90675 RepID=A0ABM0XAJ0_CAMSA|nr:PREDICTED: GPI-anchored protein LORELEI [Camelina sativa]